MTNRASVPNPNEFLDFSDQERTRLLTLGFLEISGGIPDPADTEEIASLHDVISSEVPSVEDEIIRQAVLEAREAWFRRQHSA